MSMTLAHFGNRDVGLFNSQYDDCIEHIGALLDLRETHEACLEDRVQELSINVLKKLKRDAQQITQEKIEASKANCKASQENEEEDFSKVGKSCGEGAIGFGGTPYFAYLATLATGPAGIATAGAASLTCFYVGKNFRETYRSADPEQRKQGIGRVAALFQERVRHASALIQSKIDQVIKVSKVQSKLDRSISANATLQSELAIARGESNSVRSKLQGAEQDVVDLRNELNGAKTKIESSNLRIEDLKASLQIAKDFELRACKNEEAIARMTKENEEWATAIQKEHDTAMAVLRGSNAALIEDSATTKKALQSTQSQLGDTQEKLKSTQSDLTITRADLATTRADLSTTQAELRGTQCIVKGIERDFKAMISAMKGNFTDRSIRELMRYNEGQLQRLDPIKSIQKSEAETSKLSPVHSDEEFIHVPNTTLSLPPEDCTSNRSDYSPAPQDAAANYHMATAEQQLAEGKSLPRANS